LTTYFSRGPFWTSILTRRRNLDSAAMYAYRLREQRENELGTAAYRTRAAASLDGRTTEALVMVRGAFEHDLAVIVAPREMVLYPGTRTFPGRWTFPGSNPTWLMMSETGGVFDDQPAVLRRAYSETLEGTIAGYALDSARRFLVTNW
jgi:hypothetical protein